MNIKLAISLLAVGCLPLLASASLTETSPTKPKMIPDFNNNGLSGVSENIVISGSGIQDVTDVQLTLDISGGFNGDYYAYLEHNNSSAILLNRVGLTSGNPYGYGNPGFQVTFADGAANGNIHTYQNVLNPGSSPLTGIWQPDGRTASPFQVSTSSPRNAMLDVLDGGMADGTWTLFIADCSQGGVGTLEGWSLQVNGIASVPEAPTSITGLVILIPVLFHGVSSARRQRLKN